VKDAMIAKLEENFGRYSLLSELNTLLDSLSFQ
jgi:hypothetical protein